MGKRKNRKYNNDFKLRAVKLCLETNKPDAEIARDLGVQQTTLSTWKQKYLKIQTPITNRFIFIFYLSRKNIFILRNILHFFYNIQSH